MAPFDTVLITNTVFGLPLPSAQVGPDSIRADFVYTTLLRQNNNNPKVVQALLRHASYSITMNVYTKQCRKRSATLIVE